MYTPDEKMAWETLSQEYVYKSPWLVARKDAVKLPDGRVLDDFYVLEYPEWVSVIALTEEGKMVMVEQYRYALGRVSLEIPAGTVEKNGESLLESAQRELLEETGFSGGTWEYFSCLSPSADTHTNLSHTFLATGVKRVAEQSLDPTEQIKVHLFEKRDVLEMLQKGVFFQAPLVAPLWKYFYLNPCC